MIPATFVKKITELEQSLQAIKLEFILTNKKMSESTGALYDEKKLLKESKTIRKDLWKNQYAKKASSLS